jgi:nucleotide-binding universal stress UspA family protein
MTILIGLAPGQRDDAAVHLGGMLARSSAEDVAVVSVVPAPWPPDPYGGDKEYLTYQEDLAEKTLRRARAHLDGRVTGAEYLVRRAESVPGGLLHMIADGRFSSVVVGSSSMGLLGRVMLGGAAERILHSAELPIVVAPRGFHEGRATNVTRVSVAFGRADRDSRLVARAASMAGLFHAPLRVVCFAVRPMAALVGAVEERAEQLVSKEWMQRLEDDITAALASAPDAASAGAGGRLPSPVDTALGHGSSWAEALHDVPWTDGDLLVVGISSGPLGRFFLGSHAAKIVRNSPVPVALFSRG